MRGKGRGADKVQGEGTGAGRLPGQNCLARDLGREAHMPIKERKGDFPQKRWSQGPEFKNKNLQRPLGLTYLTCMYASPWDVG